MVTQKDIAQKAGVTQALVSLALKGHPSVAENTRNHIKAIARELGYRPNAALSAAAASRWKQTGGIRRETLAFIRSIPNKNDSEPLNFHLLKSHLDYLGYGLRVVSPRDYRTEESLSRTLYNAGIRGVFLAQQSNQDRLRALEWQHFAIIQCGLLRKNTLTHLVMLDFQELINQALDRCMEAGFGRVLFLMAQEGQYYSDYLMLQVVRGAQLSDYYKTISMKIVTVGNDEQSMSDALEQIRKYRPEVVIQGINNIHKRLDNYRSVDPPPIPLSLNGDWEDETVPGFESQTCHLWHLSAELMDILLRTNSFGLPDVPKRIKFVPTWKGVPLTRDWCR